MNNHPKAYLDYAASAPLKPAAQRAVVEVLEEAGNPSSVHAYGRAARSRMETARQSLAEVMDVKPAQVIFTSGATEANATALGGLHFPAILCMAGEHASVLQNAPGATLIRMRESGLLDFNHLQDCLKAVPEGALVSIMLVNNETGVVQPVAEAAKMAKAHGAIVHCDAAQALGRVAFTPHSLGADMVSLSAHKCGGPKGVGALLVREGLNTKPLLTGGGQEMRRRAGTENIAGIAGFGVAAALAGEDIAMQNHWASWRDTFEARLVKEAPEAVIFGHTAPRVGNICCLSMPQVKNETQVMAFDLAGYAVSAGAACSSGKIQPSHVLEAMGADKTMAGRAIRVSFGWKTKPEELEGLAREWLLLYNKGRQTAA